MRLRDENKRRMIVQSAVKLFSEHSFQSVHLDDVAAAAGVGKGTVYIYFKNKEDLYYTLVYDGFAELVQKVGEQLGASRLSFKDQLRIIVDELVDYAIHHPQLFEAMRTVAIPSANSFWDAKRQEFTRLIEEVIRQGVAAGEFMDTQPAQTALYVPAMVRAVMLYGPKITAADAPALSEHMIGLILQGIEKARL